MGISGLLPLLKEIQVQGNIKEFRGKRCEQPSIERDASQMTGGCWLICAQACGRRE
jgi:hypothetical protein